MSETESKPTKSAQLEITRQIAERVEFVARDPEHLPGELWDSVKNEKRFTEIKHSLLNYGSERYHGLGAEAIAGYNGFIEGASMVLDAIRQAVEEQDTESQ